MLTSMKRKINSITIIVGDFNTLLTSIDRSTKQKISKETQTLNDTRVGCMRQALGPGALGGPGGSGWRGRWEGGSGWGRHVNSRTFHFNVWQNSLQIKKINKKK